MSFQNRCQKLGDALAISPCVIWLWRKGNCFSILASHCHDCLWWESGLGYWWNWTVIEVWKIHQHHHPVRDESLWHRVKQEDRGFLNGCLDNIALITGVRHHSVLIILVQIAQLSFHVFGCVCFLVASYLLTVERDKAGSSSHQTGFFLHVSNKVVLLISMNILVSFTWLFLRLARKSRHTNEERTELVLERALSSRNIMWVSLLI